MVHSIAGMIDFQFFAIPMVGADVCGFNGKCEQELAIRWHQLGSFYPFFRNHNILNMSDQEIYQLGDDVTEICKTWLEIRYKMLPYWYTLFYRAATKGTPVIRPLWFLE